MSNLSTLFDRYKALVVFDTETSGLDFDNDQIIELAALRVERTATGGLRIAGKMDTFIKLPEGETLPENIVSLTGITDERLQTEGVQPVKAAGQIAKLMQNGPTLMIAHNAQFDACFLRGLLRGQKVGRIDWLDSLTVYKDRRAYPHKLANAIIAYDLTGKVQNSHRAIDDVLSALKKLWKVSAKAIGVPPKWLHLAAHAKKARTRKKYRNRIRRYVFEALAAEGGGGP